MDGIAPHGDTQVFDTAAHAPISSPAVVQEGCPEDYFNKLNPYLFQII